MSWMEVIQEIMLRTVVGVVIGTPIGLFLAWLTIKVRN
jgi:ABC-type antimicrobial peptide transport system permease subunit